MVPQLANKLPLEISQHLLKTGFIHIPSSTISDLLNQSGITEHDKASFRNSWNHLKPDLYMKDGGKYRERRYAVYRLSKDKFELQPHQAHFQSLEFNHLNGGIERWFEPIEEEVLQNPCLQLFLSLLYNTASKTSDNCRTFHAEIHQFRIIANEDTLGYPSPEGLHQDGRDIVSITMINRQDVEGGIETVTNLSEDQTLAEFTLSKEFETAVVNDKTTKHSVSPITPFKPANKGIRDVFVVTICTLEQNKYASI